MSKTLHLVRQLSGGRWDENWLRWPWPNDWNWRVDFLQMGGGLRIFPPFELIGDNCTIYGHLTGRDLLLSRSKVTGWQQLRFWFSFNIEFFKINRNLIAAAEAFFILFSSKKITIYPRRRIHPWRLKMTFTGRQFFGTLDAIWGKPNKHHVIWACNVFQNSCHKRHTRAGPVSLPWLVQEPVDTVGWMRDKPQNLLISATEPSLKWFHFVRVVSFSNKYMFVTKINVQNSLFAHNNWRLMKPFRFDRTFWAKFFVELPMTHLLIFTGHQNSISILRDSTKTVKTPCHVDTLCMKFSFDQIVLKIWVTSKIVWWKLSP